MTQRPPQMRLYYKNRLKSGICTCHHYVKHLHSLRTFIPQEPTFTPQGTICIVKLHQSQFLGCFNFSVELFPKLCLEDNFSATAIAPHSL